MKRNGMKTGWKLIAMFALALVLVLGGMIQPEMAVIAKAEINDELTKPTAERPEAEKDGDASMAEADRFSSFTVEFTYNDRQYVLPGHTQVPLRTVLEPLGLTGEVTAVEVSDESLFSACNADGEWIIASCQAFHTTEWMTVTIGGVTYEITVTDDLKDKIDDFFTGKEKITYVDENGKKITTTNYKMITDNTTVLMGGVYVTFTDNYTKGTPLPCLRLYEDTTIVLHSGIRAEGIYTGGYDLTICKEMNGSYGMNIGDDGIFGSGRLILCSGQVTVGSIQEDRPACGPKDGTFVKGGKLTVVGGNGGAIGGPYRVEISGGDVIAKNINSGAAIGGGYMEAGKVLITGGTVDAYSSHGAAIGNGMDGYGGSITITGGTVYAKGMSGIGGGNCNHGYCENSGSITINGGHVTAESTQKGQSGICTRFVGGAGLTLGWTKIDDRISGNFVAGDFFASKVSFEDGKYFWLGDTGTAAMPGNLDGRTLIPCPAMNVAQCNFYTVSSSTPWKTQWATLGAKLTDPGDPFAGQAGYIFRGWRLGSYDGSAWDFNRAVGAAVNLYADYSYTIGVTLKFNNGQPDQTVQVIQGDRLTRPADPTQKSATFQGWKKTGDSGAYDFNTAVYEPFTLEAQWEYQGIAYEGGVTGEYTAMPNLSGTTLKTGDYVVTDDQTIDARLNVSGTVNLILMDGATLTATNGITVNEGNTLNIYGQSGGTGKLFIDPIYGDDNAGIGGDWYHHSGTINIYGGVIESKGKGAAAGIGGGRGHRGTVNIYGGTVTARPGQKNAAAIGGGANAGAEVTIYGGTVYAYADVYDQCGAGIGGGYGGSNTRITIYGGTVYANNSSNGAGIGGGIKGSNTRVTIYGGDITASGNKGADIGAGRDGSDTSVTFKWDETHKTPITLSNAQITSPTFESSFMLQETGEVADAGNIKGKTMVPCYAIRFDGDGTDGEMAARAVAIGGSVTLPECDFTAPEGRTFICWTDADGAEYQPGQTVTPTGDLTLSALWLSPQTLSFEGYVETSEEVTDEEGHTTTQTVQDHSAFEVRYGDSPFINAVTGAHTPVTWYSSDTTVATVNQATGEVTLLNVGETAIHAAAARSETWASAEAYYLLTVLPRQVENPTVLVEGSGHTYTGAAVTPGITVKDGETVIPSDEYTLEWKNNVKAGVATVTVTDLPGGGYDIAPATAEFTIAPKPVTVTGITAKNKHYDDTTAAELDFSDITFSGLVEGESLTATADGEFAMAEAGGNITVNITNISLGGKDAANYVLTADTATTTATIYAPHTVRFVDTDGTSVLETQTVRNGAYADRPTLQADPVKAGYRFIGWDLDGAAFNFEAPLDYDDTRILTLTPRFSELYEVGASARSGNDTGDGSFSWTSSGGGSASDVVDSESDFLMAVAGDTITVTAIPNEGSALAWFSIQSYYEYGNGEYCWTSIPFTVTESNENQATFTVPGIPETHTVENGDGNTVTYNTSKRTVYVSGSFTSTINSLTLEKDGNGFYQIGSAQDLLKLKKWMEQGHDLAGEGVKLTHDIDLTGAGFSGLGSFNGTFNGNGYAITGWGISNDGSAGFFRHIGEGGTVENLTLKGSVAGSGEYKYVGGVAAENNGSIINCVCRVTVSDNSLSNNGGIAGYNNGTVSNCAYLGMGGSGYTPMNPVGLMGGNGTATGCTALYSISCSDNDYDGIVTVQNAVDDYYPAGSQVILSLSAPAKAGWTLNGFKYQVYNDASEAYEDVNLTRNADGTYTLTVPETNVILLPNYSYNALASLTQDSQNRYLIRTKADLQAVTDVAAALDGCRGMSFLLDNDLENVGSFGGIAVGTDEPFNGVFDGGEHTISGMRITAEESYVGFIGNMGAGAELKRLTLRNCTVVNNSDYGYTGMLAGSGWSASLNDCFVTGGSVAGPDAGAISGDILSGSNNLYTPDVRVFSDGEEKVPGTCGTSDGDKTGSSSVNYAKVVWTVSFVDAFDGETPLAAPMLVPGGTLIEAAPTVTNPPVHEHYAFADLWVTPDGEIFDFSQDTIEADTLLYGAWIPDASYSVTLSDANGTSDVLNVFVTVAEAGWRLPSCNFVPATGKEFSHWLYNGTAYNAGDTLVFDSDITLTAVWNDTDYLITAQAGIHGEITVQATANYNENVSVAVRPDTGYELNMLTCKNRYGESVTVTATGNGYSFSMPASNVILTAAFRPVDYTITATLEHGSLRVNREQADLTRTVTAHYGDTVDVLPDSGYALDTLTVRQSENAVPVEEDTFTMPAGNVTVTATFREIPMHTVAFAAGYANPTGSMEDSTVEEGEVYLLPSCGFDAPAGRMFKEWSVKIGDAEAVAMDVDEVFTVTADTVVTAVWQDIPVFGKPDFTLPEQLTTIEESAFEGDMLITIVDAGNCTSIGPNAFKGCTGLKQIRLDGDCNIDATAFSGCGTVFVFAQAGGSTQDFCNDYNNLIFVEIPST